MNSPSLTNTLLVIISSLLLVLTIQNGRDRSSLYERPQISPHAQSLPGPAGSNALMEHIIFFESVLAFPEGCQEVSLLSECTSPQALKIKEKIQVWIDQNKGPKNVFDEIVKTWGEEVLTAQARQIRNQRKSTKQ